VATLTDSVGMELLDGVIRGAGWKSEKTLLGEATASSLSVARDELLEVVGMTCGIQFPAAEDCRSLDVISFKSRSLAVKIP